MAIAVNTRTGKTVSVPEHYIGHPVLGKDLEPFGGAEVQAAPKKEKKNRFAKADYKIVETSETDDLTEEQPAPDNIEENEE